MIKEKAVRSVPGIPAFLFLLALVVVVSGTLIWYAANVMGGAESVGILQVLGLLVIIGVLVAILISMNGLTIVHPNEARALILFGNYFGTLREQGPWWVNPFTERKRISVKIRNFESSQLKVNDHDGNPIAIAAVVVWRVEDTAKASFDVDNYENYVKLQSEAALRHLASSFAYDHGDLTLAGAPEPTLLASGEIVSRALVIELQQRLGKAGVAVEEARLMHLAYAPEIAQVMLRRQQAEAIIAARQKIVHGAVSMVEMALNELSDKKVVALDDERKAAMVSNLMTVLCSESDVQPVINTGTLYN